MAEQNDRPIRGPGFNTDPQTGDWDELAFDNHNLNERVRGENTDTDDAFAIYVQGVSTTTKVFNVLKTGAMFGGSGAYATLSASANVTFGAVAAAGTGTAALRSDATLLLYDGTLPAAEVFGSVGTTGSSSLAPRRDHVHPMPATPVTSIAASGNTALTGVVLLYAGSGVGLTQTGQGIQIMASAAVPAGASAGAPALILGTTNVAGGTNFIGVSSIVQLYDTTAPSTWAFGTAVVQGVGSFAARSDHGHGVPSLAAPLVVLGTTQSIGSAVLPFPRDSMIAAFDATVPASVGTANITGVVNFAARRDHGHLNSLGLYAMGSVASAAGGGTNFTPILFTTEEYDPLGFHSVGSAGIWKPTIAGFYECTIRVGYIGSAAQDDLQIISFLVNSSTRYDVMRGETRSAGVSSNPAWNGTLVIPTVFNGSTDYVEATYYLGAGTTAYGANFSIKKVV